MAYQIGSLLHARGREWVVLPDSTDILLKLRPIGVGENATTWMYVPLERQPIRPATFPPPTPTQVGTHSEGLLLCEALRLAFRSGAGPFRSFGNLAFSPRAYQLVPLLMALKMDTIRLLIADDVGIGKTIEAGLIVRELHDRGEILSFSVLCPPHLCHQWKEELQRKFNFSAEIVTTATASRLERNLHASTSLFDYYPVTVVSLDYIKQDRRRDEFLRACPNLVLVDEVHTCVQGNYNTRHQRYQLLTGLAKKQDRHMILLTATPHSGDEEAFYNLLGLLHADFKRLNTENRSHDPLRERLGGHLVQRRRADIAEWLDSSVFPKHENKEAPYFLKGEWGSLFNDILQYAQNLVKLAEDKSTLQKRMQWWSALALLRCISSSPEAAVAALRTRIQVPIDNLDQVNSETVLDEDTEGNLSSDDSLPGTFFSKEAEVHPDTPLLEDFIRRAQSLYGPTEDSKLQSLLIQLQELLNLGHNPVIFCRYIATANYVGRYVQDHFGSHTVSVVTGELTPEERQEKVLLLGEKERRILVATDCLSEGINLQDLFDAVLHYDLSWNPTRHEQREGRVDRFGQTSKIVRTILLYGENNPVDGTVLQVILRKAARIRKELGVSPMPDPSEKVMNAILEGVLFRQQRPSAQEDLFGPYDQAQDKDWQDARDKIQKSRTIFAQRRLKPAEVLPEWHKAVAALGSQKEVERFIFRAAARLRAPLQPHQEGFTLPISFLPETLRERLKGIGISGESQKTEFQQPSSPHYLHRSHPLVAAFSNYFIEQALDAKHPDPMARCGAIFTSEVITRTLVVLLRLRTQLTTTYHGDRRILLAEEALFVTLQSDRLLLESDPSAQSIVIHDALSTHVKSVHGLDASTSEVTSPPTLGFCRPYTRALLPGLPPVADVQGTPETCGHYGWIPEELQTAFSDRTVLKSADERPISRSESLNVLDPIPRHGSNQRSHSTSLSGSEEQDAMVLMNAKPTRNMDPHRQKREIQEALEILSSAQPLFETLAKKRAKQLLEDHQRVREASKTRFLEYKVIPCLPVDVIGLYVLLPTPAFGS